MLKLIVSNLRERPTRAVVSILAVALGVALVLVSVGLANGQLTEHASRIQNIGGDIILQPPSSSHILALSSASLAVRLEGKIREIEGVDDVAPILVQVDGWKQIFGVQERFASFNRNLRFVKGRMFQGPHESVVDTIYAKSNQVDVGSTEKLLNQEFRIAGIFEAGTTVRVMMPMSTMQDLAGSGDKCSAFFIRVDEAPGRLDHVEQELQRVFDGYTITRSSVLQEMWINNTPAVRPFFGAIVSISVVVSFLIILLSMYSTITERTREIGILRSLGASRSYVVQLILKESFLICLIGVAFGFAFNVLGLYFVGRAHPTLPVDIPLFWRVAAPVMAIIGGTVGALYPAIKAARLDPVRALGYE